MRATKKAEIILDMIQHFHPISIMYAGWTVKLNAKQAALIEENFDNLRVYKEKRKTLVERKKGKAGKFSPEHTILMLKFERDMYMTEEDKLRGGLRKLLDD